MNAMLAAPTSDPFSVVLSEEDEVVVDTDEEQLEARSLRRSLQLPRSAHRSAPEGGGM